MPNNHLAQWLAHTFCSYFLFRQFFPKKMPLHKVTEKERFKATDLMNNRPRKCLGYKTLMEVFSRAMGIDHNINPSVAHLIAMSHNLKTGMNIFKELQRLKESCA